MRKKKPVGEIIGLASLGVGIAFMAWANIKKFSPEGIGRVGVVVGVLLICYQKLVHRTTANDDAYKLGYDIGYEAGHQVGHALARPVVVDLESKRCKCGNPATLTPAGSVVDRG